MTWAIIGWYVGLAFGIGILGPLVVDALEQRKRKK